MKAGDKVLYAPPGAKVPVPGVVVSTEYNPRMGMNAVRLRTDSGTFYDCAESHVKVPDSAPQAG